MHHRDSDTKVALEEDLKKNTEHLPHSLEEYIHQGCIPAHNVLARVHLPLLCNLAGAYLLEPTYPCPIVCLSEPLPGNGTDKALCC